MECFRPFVVVTGLILRRLGLCTYEPVWSAMRAMTAARHQSSEDEIWVVQHHPVYTLGRVGRMEHLLNTGEIGVVHSDRGGQVTYHGPGQIILYVMIDLVRKGWGVKHLVNHLEQVVIDFCEDNGIIALRRKDAPGVYVGGKKVAALGLRVSNGCSYHGLAVNADMDLDPFSGIDPCGLSDLQVTQLRDLGIAADVVNIEERLLASLMVQLGYTYVDVVSESTELPSTISPNTG